MLVESNKGGQPPTPSKVTIENTATGVVDVYHGHVMAVSQTYEATATTHTSMETGRPVTHYTPTKSGQLKLTMEYTEHEVAP